MVERVKQAARVMSSCPGFLATDCWIEEDGDSVVAVGTFESKEQWLQAMQVVAAAEVDFDYDERELRPRQVQLFFDS
jgi:hypothetical protein